MVYLISYDLHKIKNYPLLRDTIKSLGNCISPLESLWLVDTSMTLLQLNDIVLKAVDNDDSYYITTISNKGAGRLSKESWQWINGKFADLRTNPLQNLMGSNPIPRKNLKPPFGKL